MDTNHKSLCIICKCLTESIYGRAALNHQEKMSCPMDVSSPLSFITIWIEVAKWTHEWRLCIDPTLALLLTKLDLATATSECLTFSSDNGYWTLNMGPFLTETTKPLGGILISLAPSALQKARISPCLGRQSAISLEHPCIFFLGMLRLQGPHSSYSGHFSE